MSGAGVQHPDRLPWFADGKLDPAEMAAVEAHLAACDACREEVEALRSLYRSLRASTPSEHVSPERLVAYHQGSELPAGERRLVEDHVRACQACASDLSALRRARSAGRGKDLKRFIGTAASVMLVTVAVWQFGLRRTAPPLPPPVTRVVFAPAQRGAEAGHRLEGGGPWVLEVWAPPRTAASYVARIERSDAQGPAAFVTIVAAASDDGRVLVSVPGPLKPGHHVLSLSPSVGDGTPVYTRGFDVVRRP